MLFTHAAFFYTLRLVTQQYFERDARVVAVWFVLLLLISLYSLFSLAVDINCQRQTSDHVGMTPKSPHRGKLIVKTRVRCSRRCSTPEAGPRRVRKQPTDWERETRPTFCLCSTNTGHSSFFRVASIQKWIAWSIFCQFDTNIFLCFQSTHNKSKELH